MTTSDAAKEDTKEKNKLKALNAQIRAEVKYQKVSQSGLRVLIYLSLRANKDEGQLQNRI